MKKTALVLGIACCFMACTDGKVDKQKLDAAGDKVQKGVERAADTIAKKAGQLKDSIVRDRDDTIR
ncbi:hypothetical protein EXU57_02825 [Segetibacter sp. 3557_3]|uniref:hypothetical protein n=1 Tax=Segetibacter sp. 3557_3 TaxID=2547429 RepID=UPI001058E08D|nr:hypothetical protein [Segetibacter sp. 3557_3]TDH29025.1 hypothetical protein EXU57_02825 [Segetibacter sp. 3557_3]